MEELSMFIDESGDAIGGQSKYYLVCLVLHDQGDDFALHDAKYRQELHNADIGDTPMHLSPLMNGHDAFDAEDIEARKKRLAHFRIFSQHFPFRYHVFFYEKRHFKGEAALEERLRRGALAFLRANLTYFQRFDHVKIYYDGGQTLVTQAVRAAVSEALSKEAIVYRDASPLRFRLQQLADYVCGLELTAVKYERGEQTATDLTFFGERGSFKKNWLKKARKKLLP